MKRLAKLCVDNPVPVNLLMIAIIALGSVAFLRLPRELMSDISFNWVFIMKAYPGVSAEEIERLITVPIEEEIADVKGIDTVTSQSSEGGAFLSVKFLQMSDEEFRARFEDLRAEVARVRDLPRDALETQVMAFGSTDFVPLISVHLYGELPDGPLFELGKRLREELLLVPGIGKVELVGVRDREIWVEADPARLEGHALSPLELQAAIATRGVNVPAGRVTLGRQDVLVRAVGEFAAAEEIGRVIVRGEPNGGLVRVADVAEVRDTFAEAQTKSRLNGRPVVSLTLSKRKDASSIDVIDEAKRRAQEFVGHQGGAVELAFTQDNAELIRDVLGKLNANALMGFFVVVAVLLVVLGIRNAVLAGLGIPLSFLACFIFLEATGESLNGNSLFGLVLVLGIIVDDAIIIVENCHRHLQMGKGWREAAIDGTAEVGLPVLAATATTIAAFLPLILLPGIVGKFMRIIPITVSLALVASLVEAFVILPSHFAEWPGRRARGRHEDPRWMQRLQDRYERFLRHVVARRRRYVLGLVAAMPIAGVLVSFVGVDMFAGEEINTFQVRVRMPTGTSLEATQAALSEVEQAAAALPRDDVRSVHATAGLVVTDDDWITRSDGGQVWLDLPLSYSRRRSTDAIMVDLRRRIERVAGPEQIELVKAATGPPVGKPVEVKVRGKELAELERAAEAIKAYLAAVDGVIDIGDDLDTGSQEIRVRVDPERAALFGLGVSQVGLALRAAVDGIEAGRLYLADDAIDIRVRVNRGFFDDAEDLLRLPVATGAAGPILLRDVARLEPQPSVAQIRRYRNQRAITVFAGVDEAKTTAVDVTRRMEKDLIGIVARHPGVTLDFSGEFQEFKESFKSLAQLFLLGILLIYVILGAQFRSYLQPVVILLTVPFGFIGAIVGLLISGNPVSISTLFGVVALAGVAVNDAIVLISFANNAKAEGVAPEEAVVQAGRLRLRPILLTSITTVAGLLPMAMGLGGMSLTWGPLANTIVWGLMASTLLTLFFIPSVYLLVVHDLPDFVRRVAGRRPAADNRADARLA